MDPTDGLGQQRSLVLEVSIGGAGRHPCLLGRFQEAETLDTALGDDLQRVVDERLTELSVVEVGAGDMPMTKKGDHGALSPTNFTGRMLARFAIDPRVPAFEPDTVVTAELDLLPWGVAGRALAMPGRTTSTPSWRRMTATSRRCCTRASRPSTWGTAGR